MLLMECSQCCHWEACTEGWIEIPITFAIIENNDFAAYMYIFHFPEHPVNMLAKMASNFQASGWAFPLPAPGVASNRIENVHTGPVLL